MYIARSSSLLLKAVDEGSENALDARWKFGSVVKQTAGEEDKEKDFNEFSDAQLGDNPSPSMHYGPK